MRAFCCSRDLLLLNDVLLLLVLRHLLWVQDLHSLHQFLLLATLHLQLLALATDFLNVLLVLSKRLLLLLGQLAELGLLLLLSKVVGRLACFVSPFAWGPPPCCFRSPTFGLLGSLLAFALRVEVYRNGFFVAFFCCKNKFLSFSEGLDFFEVTCSFKAGDSFPSRCGDGRFEAASAALPPSSTASKLFLPFRPFCFTASSFGFFLTSCSALAFSILVPAGRFLTSLRALKKFVFKVGRIVRVASFGRLGGLSRLLPGRGRVRFGLPEVVRSRGARRLPVLRRLPGSSTLRRGDSFTRVPLGGGATFSTVRPFSNGTFVFRTKF